MTEQVMRDSAEAAQYRTDIKGWVSRRGIFYGDNPGSEHAARYDGCTHTACRTCGGPVEKMWTKCQGCRDVSDGARWEAMPAAPWDGQATVYSQTLERYYSEPGDAYDDLDDGQTMGDLQLVICRPNYVPQLEGDYCSNEVSDDDEGLPAEVEAAMAAFNQAVAGIVLSWSPGKTRLAPYRTDSVRPLAGPSRLSACDAQSADSKRPGTR